MNNERISGLSSPANSSLQQSFYIAALDRHLGIRGLISPVTDDESSLDYDFFHADSGAVIKILRSLDQKAIAQYEQSRRENSVFIVDAYALDEIDCDECDGKHPDLESKILHTAVLVLDAYLYMDDQLWAFDPEGCEWEPILPIERRRCIESLYNMDEE